MRHVAALGLTLLLGLPSLVEAQWQEGVAAYRSGDYETAAARFRSYLEASPDSAAARYMLGSCLLGLERTTEALEQLRRARDLEPETAKYALKLTQASLAAGDRAGAWSAIAGLDPAEVEESLHAAYTRLLASAAAQSEDAERTAPVLARATRSFTDTVELWDLLGRAETDRGRPEAAHAAFAAALGVRASGDLATLCVGAASAAAEASPSEELRAAWYRRVAECAESAPKMIASLRQQAATARLNAGDFAAARVHFETMAPVPDGDAARLHALGRCSLGLGEEVRALAELERAAAAAPDSDRERRIYRQIALIHHRNERYAEAAEAYARAGEGAAAAQLAAAAAQRRQEAVARRECLRDKEQADEMLAEMAPLRGTRDWDVMVRELQKLLARCRDVIALAPPLVAEEPMPSAAPR